MRNAVWAAACDARRAGRALTIQAISSAAWVSFTAKADLSDGKWTIADCDNKTIATVAKIKAGGIPYFPAATVGLTPHWKLNPKSLATVRATLVAEIKSFFAGSDHNRVCAIRMQPGMGKTTAALAEVARLAASGSVIYFLVPTLVLADEVAVALGPTIARVQRGRDSGSPALCQRNVEAAAIAQAGFNVRKHLCKSCALRTNCNYLAQDSDSRSVIVLTHAYLGVPLPSSWPRPDYIIIDESFWEQTVSVKRESLSAVLACCPPIVKLLPPVAKQLQLPETLDLAETIRAGLQSGELLHSLRALGSLAPDLLASAAEIAKTREVAPRLTGRTKPEAFTAALRGARSTAALVAFFRTLARELSSAPTRGVSHVARLVGETIHLSLPRPMGWLAGVPVLILDAQVEEKIIERIFFERPSKFVTLDAQRSAYVIQAENSASSKTRLQENSDLAERCCRFADSLLGRTLLVAQKTIRLTITKEPTGSPLPVSYAFSDNLSVAHYGNLRGTNTFSDFDNVVLLGRSEPPSLALSDYSGLFWRDADPLKIGEYVYRDRGYTAPGGRGVSVRVLPDDRLQTLVEQTREWGVVQALDRLRLFDPKRLGHVFLLTNLPVPVSVDRLVSEDALTPEWADLAGQLDGLLVASASDLCRRLPGRFPDRRAAERWLAGPGEVLANLPDHLRILLRDPVGLPNPNTAAFRFRSKPTRRDRVAPLKAGVFIGPPLALTTAITGHTPTAEFWADLPTFKARMTNVLTPEDEAAARAAHDHLYLSGTQHMQKLTRLESFNAWLSTEADAATLEAVALLLATPPSSDALLLTSPEMTTLAQKTLDASPKGGII